MLSIGWECRARYNMCCIKVQFETYTADVVQSIYRLIEGYCVVITDHFFRIGYITHSIINMTYIVIDFTLPTT